MRLVGAERVMLFPHTYYNSWQGTPTESKNRLLSVIDYSESAYYGNVAANALDLASFAPNTAVGWNAWLTDGPTEFF
jgi:hypothetical protein